MRVPTDMYGLPAYGFRLAPDGLATKHQLAEDGKRPGGEPVAVLVWRGDPGHRPQGASRRKSWLYDVDAALPRRTPTPGRLAQLAAARARKRICPECLLDAGYVIPKRYGECLHCAERREVRSPMSLAVAA